MGHAGLKSHAAAPTGVAALAAPVAVGFDGGAALDGMTHVPPDIANGLAIWRPVGDPPGDGAGRDLPFLNAAAGRAGGRFA